MIRQSVYRLSVFSLIHRLVENCQLSEVAICLYTQKNNQWAWCFTKLPIPTLITRTAFPSRTKLAGNSRLCLQIRRSRVLSMRKVSTTIWPQSQKPKRRNCFSLRCFCDFFKKAVGVRVSCLTAFSSARQRLTRQSAKNWLKITSWKR